VSLYFIFVSSSLFFFLFFKNKYICVRNSVKVEIEKEKEDQVLEIPPLSRMSRQFFGMDVELFFTTELVKYDKHTCLWKSAAETYKPTSSEIIRVINDAYYRNYTKLAKYLTLEYKELIESSRHMMFEIFLIACKNGAKVQTEMVAFLITTFEIAIDIEKNEDVHILHVTTPHDSMSLIFTLNSIKDEKEKEAYDVFKILANNHEGIRKCLLGAIKPPVKK
jgi:hypothetical protein